ncbi:uncharacterized protein [Antennarius striatus]|uniref:uncharacterized protein isoform X1 n=1 Tax=Antennarius striatus TaxID=241820 RepID=UPI0035B13D0B
MTFVAPTGMECLLRRCHQEAGFSSVFRSVLITVCLILVLCVSLYPGLWSIGVRLHSAWTGSFVPGHHSILLLNSPAEQAAKDIGRRWRYEGDLPELLRNNEISRAATESKLVTSWRSTMMQGDTFSFCSCFSFSFHACTVHSG